MSQKLEILFIPSDPVGHVSAAIGIAQVLINCGHHVIFAINEQWSGKLSKYGIEELTLTEEDRHADGDPAEHWAKTFMNKGSNPLDIMISIYRFLPELIEKHRQLDLIIEDLLKTIRPNVIIIDNICIPSVVKSGIPWVLTCSTNILVLIDDERTPPGNSGLSSYGDKNEWKQFRDTFNREKRQTCIEYNKFVISRGGEPLDDNKLINDSKYLNIYSFPQELDYLDLRPLPPNWHRFDNFMRTENNSNFEIPVQLREKSGKLIYFSLGSMGGTDVSLMKRLVTILAKSKNKFIVGKGPLHSQYSLADNMWGQQTVPQTQVLPLVDLVITHGGNNTLTETFYFGKPLIVMPLFGDQYDNAQRVEEKGFGIRLNPHNCSEEELLNAIENLLNNKELNRKLKTISERIQSENSIGKLPKMIEDLVSANKP